MGRANLYLQPFALAPQVVVRCRCGKKELPLQPSVGPKMMNQLALLLATGTELLGVAYKKVSALAKFCRLRLPSYQSYLSYNDAVSEIEWIMLLCRISASHTCSIIVQVVAPAIDDVYAAHQQQVIDNELSAPSSSRGICIAMDAQWHSVGHSSRIGTVTAMSARTRSFFKRTRNISCNTL